jgi:hypothetical protein
MNVPRRLPEGSRPWLAAGGTLALAFGWAAFELPWRPAAPLGLLLWALAALHLCAAASVAFLPTRAARALRLLGLASLGSAPVFALALGSTAVSMVRMFGPLGWGLSVALAAIGWLLVLATLPVGLLALRAAAARDSGHARG